MRVLILGATGNIGQQAITVIKKLNYELVGISFNHNHELATQIKVPYKYSPSDSIHSNVRNFNELIKKSNPDIVVNAIVGFAGLNGTIAAIKQQRTLCLANKESLVVAGQFIMKLAKQNCVKIYPIDSEHASLYQIIHQTRNEKFQKLYITASGGPFYKLPPSEWKNVTVKQAINHPTWKMGGKISIDSATLVNKCFEIVEAYWYFHTKKIEALYHPQSLVHAMVKYRHQKLIFVSKPDMKLPIYQALTAFQHQSQNIVPCNQKYEMKKIDQKKWIPIQWASQILKNPCSSLPVIINAANEYAVYLFMKNLIKFDQIIPLITQCIKHFKIIDVSSLQQLFGIHKKVNSYLSSLQFRQSNIK
ncbi:MAG: 1-deoxy-D-xylulose 5-phosphate reductoisomerase [Mycoplasmataceae bacterium]|nr:1-deoxy-D-xylulose 5-phosphate reductoisomerase [Mycoplasmataceae bacterium]